MTIKVNPTDLLIVIPILIVFGNLKNIYLRDKLSKEKAPHGTRAYWRYMAKFLLVSISMGMLLLAGLILCDVIDIRL